MDKEKSLKNTNLIKMILMITIVFYHSIIFMNGTWFTAVSVKPVSWISYPTVYLNSFLVYAFTFISGYIFYYLKNEKQSYSSYKEFALKKVKRLLIPYLVFTFLWALPMDIALYGFDFSMILHNFILGESPEQLWFLLMLFLVFLLFYPLADFFKKKWTILIAVSCYLISIVGTKYIGNYFQVMSVFRYITFFYFGYAMRQYLEDKIKPNSFWIWALISVAFYVTYCFAKKGEGTLLELTKLGLFFVTEVAGVLMIWTLFQFLFRKVEYQNSKFVKFLTERSMIVYLLHQQFIYLTVFFLYDKINVFVLGLLNFVVSIIISLLLSSLLLLTNPTRFIVGEKKLLKAQCESLDISK